MSPRTPKPGAEQALQRGQRLLLTLGGMSALGECIAEAAGFPIHVFGGIPGEQVVAEVVRCFRHHATARVVEVLASSPDRVEPPCRHFWPCTGCQWQHVRYDRQLTLKREMLAEAIGKHALPEPLPLWPTLPSPQVLGYRNHARFTIGPGGSLGFVNRATRSFVPVDRCPIMHPVVNEVLQDLQGKAAETTQLSVRCGSGTGEVLVQPRLRNADVTRPTGQLTYEEEAGGRRFRVASPSFFQVNTPQMERLVGLLQGHLAPARHGVVVDAYAGVGTFSVLLAPYAGRVIGIEESVTAVRDAEHNAGGLSNVQFLRGKAETLLAALQERPDMVVLDPPRAGCHPDALAAVARLAPQTLLYVSCEPETLGRDLALLVAGQFRLAALYPVDMFPQTHHVECVAVLHHTSDTPSASQTLTLASGSPRRRELLQALGAPFDVAPSGVDERTVGAGGDPAEQAMALALAKARDVAVRRTHHGIVLGADTLVALDGEPFGKPASPQEARWMLGRLRGRPHEVFTGVALVDAATGQEQSLVERSVVSMRDFTDAEMEAYVATGQPFDKAGGYAVQDTVFHPAARVEGCYFNVMGLPLCALGRMLSQAGVNVPSLPPWDGGGACTVCALWAPLGARDETLTT